MKYRYKLNNLDCPNCANKIECTLNDDKNIKSANVNFSKLTLTVETNIDKNVKGYVSNIVNKIEPDVKVLEIDEDSKSNTKIHTLRVLIGIIVSVLGIFIFKGTVKDVLIILGYIILLFGTCKTAIKLLKSKTINENFLVTISCIGAYLTDNVHEGLMVIILYEIGKILEELAVNRSRKSISDLMDIKPVYANLKENNKIIKIDPNDVKIDDIIVVKTGEKIPLDGVVVSGEAKLNTAALTGESKLRHVNIGDTVLSGSINNSGLIEIKVNKIYTDSTVSRILDLVENASDRKASTETFVSKAARIYTPIILLLAILLVIILPIFGVKFETAIYRALVFLVISCPCAIAISVPLSYFTGIGYSSRNGILIKGSDYLDMLGKIDLIIFDKTGTLTTGTFSDYKLNILNKDYSKKEIIKYYVSGEVLSNHPIAKGIINIFGEDKEEVSKYKEVAGKGISYELNGKKVKIGSSSFCKSKSNDNLIYLNIDNDLVASLELLDGIKSNAKSVISKLKKLNIKTKMFTGDSKDIALEVSKKLSIDSVEAELLPEDKYNLLERELENKLVAFVGDGINDAPSLARSSIGISMGGVGSESAIEASDVVIMTDDIEKIIKGIEISKQTTKIIKQNLIFAISVKIIVLILSGFGIASMWQAVFADTGVTLLTILNTTRILKK